MRKNDTLAFAGFAVLLALVPMLWSNGYTLHVFILAMFYSVFCLAWNLVTGFGGLKTFGHHAFLGIGAYCSALLSIHLGLSPWLTIWLAALVASGVGVLAAFPVLKIRSVPHIAIVTLAFAEIVRIVASNLRGITRGEMGLVGIPQFEPVDLPLLGEIVFNASHKTGYFYLAWIMFVAAFLLIATLRHSAFGLRVIALRDSQDAAESLGVDVTRYKIALFAISAFLVGLLGAFYAHYILILTPTAVVGIDIMVLIVAMTLVGGLGTTFGPVIGAFLLVVVVELLRDLGPYRMLVYGMIIIVTMLYCPKGLVTLVAPFRRGTATEARPGA